jgi:hypothetical protein
MDRFFGSVIYWGGSISRRPFELAGLVRGSDPLKRSAEPMAGWPRNFKNGTQAFDGMGSEYLCRDAVN